MMGHREKLKGGDEWDAVCARHIYCYLARAHAAKRIKQKMTRRNRHADKIALNQTGGE